MFVGKSAPNERGPMIGEGGAGAVSLAFTWLTRALSLEAQRCPRPSVDTTHLLDTSPLNFDCLASLTFVWYLDKTTMSSPASPIIDKGSKATASASASASEQPMTAKDLVEAAFQDDRTDLRDRCRLGLYLNAIGYVQMDVMSLYVLERVQDTAPHIREYTIKKRSKPISEEPVVPEDISEEDKGAFVSINSCLEIPAFNYAWISRIIEGKPSRDL